MAPVIEVIIRAVEKVAEKSKKRFAQFTCSHP
ncbi:MAG: hypothetical protein MRERC_9c026 [Mycoplasmataceae bacterium RC_NB112A]|nr:MAG: hypothetical protein MRERC_9c026 [Mycoplasmataceae bacterium RC_NB112A]